MSGMGVDGAHNTVEENVGAYNTVDASEARGRNLTVFVWYRI